MGFHSVSMRYNDNIGMKLSVSGHVTCPTCCLISIMKIFCSKLTIAQLIIAAGMGWDGIPLMS